MATRPTCPPFLSIHSGKMAASTMTVVDRSASGREVSVVGADTQPLRWWLSLVVIISCLAHWQQEGGGYGRLDHPPRIARPG